MHNKSDLIKHLIALANARANRTIVLGTHGDDFHADELLATAVIAHEVEPLGYRIKVIRSRKERILQQCDLIYDVGGGKYDHHSNDKVFYPNGIPMAACGKILNDVIMDRKIIDGLRTRLFYAVEAHDNGVNVPLGYEASKLAFVTTLNPTWEEDTSPQAMQRRFYRALDQVRVIYARMLAIVKADISAAKYLSERAVPILGGKILLMDRACPTYSYMKTHEECIAAIYPKDQQWIIRCAPTFRMKYETRASFPKRMCGLYGADLEIECGIKGAIFCHSSGFIAAMTTREGCYELAKILISECTE